MRDLPVGPLEHRRAHAFVDEGVGARGGSGQDERKA